MDLAHAISLRIRKGIDFSFSVISVETFSNTRPSVIRHDQSIPSLIRRGGWLRCLENLFSLLKRPLSVRLSMFTSKDEQMSAVSHHYVDLLRQSLEQRKVKFWCRLRVRFIELVSGSWFLFDVSYTQSFDSTNAKSNDPSVLHAVVAKRIRKYNLPVQGLLWLPL